MVENCERNRAMVENVKENKQWLKCEGKRAMVEKEREKAENVKEREQWLRMEERWLRM